MCVIEKPAAGGSGSIVTSGPGQPELSPAPQEPSAAPHRPPTSGSAPSRFSQPSSPRCLVRGAVAGRVGAARALETQLVQSKLPCALWARDRRDLSCEPPWALAG